jgi:hypothetical protein
MAVARVCYCTRNDVKAALDFHETARANAQVDRAIQSAADLIEGELHRVFYPNDTTFKWDWPNYQYSAPWRLWFDQWDLIAATQVQSPVGTTIPIGNVIFYPPNRRPGWPYTRLELDRSTVSAFGAGPTPQLSIAVTGTWGFTNATDPAGQLAAAITTTSAISITVSDASQLGVGDLVYADTERMLVTEQAAVSTGQTNVVGGTAASAADVAIDVTDGTQIHLGEVLLLDSERMLITDITGNVATVKRAWDGTVLTTHTAGSTLYAYRQLTVLRGQLGTTAATHLINAPLSRHRPPSLVRDLSLAEAANQVLQETSGYARIVGGADTAMPAPGQALADKWDECRTTYGRKTRSRAV